jgi:hypothetical protein
VTYRLHSTTDPTGQFANEAPSLLGFTTREQLREALRQRSRGRVHLDPKQALCCRQIQFSRRGLIRPTATHVTARTRWR